MATIVTTRRVTDRFSTGAPVPVLIVADPGSGARAGAGTATVNTTPTDLFSDTFTEVFP